MMQFVKRSWPWWIVAVLVAAGLALWFGQRLREVDTVTVERGVIVQSVVATGRVATPGQVAVSAQVAARIESITVREGDPVTGGQPLVRLRSEEAQASLAAARAALSEAEGRQRQLERVQRPVAEQQLAQASANLSAAARELERARELVAQGYVSQSRVDEAQRQVDLAGAALESARAQAAAARAGGVEAEMARARIAQAKANLAGAEARLDTLVLTAPVDGVVLTRVAEPGDTAQVGRVLLTLAQAGTTRIIASVDEKNLRWLKAGQQASALADAFAGQPFAAVLTYVAPSVDAQRGTVEVWLEVAEPPGYLKPDMTVSVEMVVGRREDALRLPSWTLRDTDPALAQASASVLVLRDDRAVRQPVKLGLRGVGTVEIVEGLAEGDLVIPPESGAIEGERVRMRRARSNVNLGSVPGMR